MNQYRVSPEARADLDEIWHYIAPDWVGTTQEFFLEPQDDGEVLLKFCHGGWERGGDHCYFCNTTWEHRLVGLKDYAERGEKNPYFR